MNREVALEKLRFQFEAKKYMEVVGYLISFDTDEGAFHRIRGAPAILVVVAGEVGKGLNEIGPPGFPEGSGAADTVFPEAGLGFVNAERGGLAEGRAELGFGKTLVVETVASLVEDTVEGDHEVAFVIAGGHAGIARTKARAEGVGAGVESACRDVEADFWKKKLEEFLLIGTGVVASESFAGGWLRQGESLFGYGNEARAKFGKERSDIASQPTWFVAFEEGIVGLVGVAPEVGHLAGEGEKFFEVRGKGGEVRVFSGFDPCGAGKADGEFVFFDKFGGDTSGAMVVVAPTRDGGGFRGVGREGSAFALIEPVSDVGVGRKAVGDSGEKGGLFGTKGVAFRGEEGFLIPAQKAGGGAEKGEVFTSGAEFFVGIGKRGHGVMMKQEKVLWNVFLAGREEFFVKQDRACTIPIFKNRKLRI